MDNFFANMRLFKREAEQPAPSSEGKSPQSAQGGSFAAQAVAVTNANAALRVSPWYRAADVLAKTMAQMVLEYQKKNNDKHGGNYDTDMSTKEAKHLNYLFQMRPNPTMTAEQWMTVMTLARMNEGNGVSFIERDRVTDDIKYVWMCQSASLYFTSKGIRYNITYNDGTGSKSKSDVDPMDIIHWRNTFSNDNGLSGIGTLEFAKQALSTAATNDKQAKDQSAKGGKLKLLLQEDTSNTTFGLKKLNKDQRNKQRDDLQDALNEGKDVLLMSGLMDAKVISQNAEQMQLLQNRQFDTPVIARFTGVPLVLLMDYTNNTYKAPEQAMQAFLQHTIAPMANALAQEITTKIVGEAGWPTHQFAFDQESLMRLDPMGRANLAEKLLQTGIKCVDELRNDFGLPTLEGGIGKRHLVSTNLQPLDDLRVAGGTKTDDNSSGTVAKPAEEGGEP